MLSFGICTLAALSMRTEPTDKSELCNQLLFGELYTVMKESENKKWLYIEGEWDSYKGWISTLSHREVSEAYFVRYRLGVHAIVLEPIGKATLQDQKQTTLLPYASTLPFWDKKNIDVGYTKAISTTKVQVGKPASAKAVILQGIMHYFNAPYLWGGRTVLGVDCSGFTQNLYKVLGIRLERDAYQQIEQGQQVNIEYAKTGDLAFFQRDGRIVHVGVVISATDLLLFDIKLPKDQNMAIAHALDTVRIDVLDTQGIFNLQHEYYTHHLAGIVRVSE